MQIRNFDEVKPQIVFLGERYFTRTDLSRATGLSPQTYAGYATRGKGPAFVKLGKRCLYSEKSVQKWIQDQTIIPGQDKPPKF